MKLGIELSLRGANTVVQATRDIEQQMRATSARFDELSKKAARGEISIKQLGAAGSAMRTKMTEARKEIARLDETVGKTAIGKYAANMKARSVLGVRAENDIQKEIKSTQQAYQTLVRNGTLSWRAQAAAADKMRGKVTSLTNEMGKLTAAQKAMGAAKGAFALGVGTLAAGATLVNPAKEAMSYDRRLAGGANTAYGERDAAGRLAGMKELEVAIDKARIEGKGTREDTAGALFTMVESGVVSVADAIKMLPGIVKAATASGASADDLSTIAIRASQTMGIAVEDIPKILSAAMKAGQEGGFELKDMAKWLPKQMAMAKNLGMLGEKDFARILAYNQAAVITAGGKDEAGNNVKALFSDLNTDHFKRFLAEQFNAGRKAKPGERQKRILSVEEMYLNYQARGIGKVDATLDIIEKLFSKNKNYQALQGKLAKAKEATDAEKQSIEAGMGTDVNSAAYKDGKLKLKALKEKDEASALPILQAMIAQMEGNVVSKLFHNQETFAQPLSNVVRIASCHFKNDF